MSENTGFRLGRIAGVEIRVDWSLAIVFWLIVTNLGGGLLPSRHPQWSPALTWTVAILAAVLFFVSVLIHELAHALVGRRRGVPVVGITLFMFGGVARMAGEPKSPGSEFWMAFVGPLASLAIAAVCTVSGLALAAATPASPTDLANLSPAASVLLWLGTTNFMLAVFNILPGFPLDGGRVFRAILWKLTGDVRKATRGAAAVGRGLAILIIFAGISMLFGTELPVLGGGAVQGLWLVLIGWFLNNAAIASYHQLVVGEILADVPVTRLMRTDVTAVPADLPVRELVDRYFMQGDQLCLPVMQGARLLGIVCLSDLRKLPKNDWDRTPVAAIMTPATDHTAVRPEENAADALAKLASRDVDQLPVVQNGKLAGVLRRADLLRWIELHGAA